MGLESVHEGCAVRTNMQQVPLQAMLLLYAKHMLYLWLDRSPVSSCWDMQLQLCINIVSV
jgi:hypothetical protein